MTVVKIIWKISLSYFENHVNFAKMMMEKGMTNQSDPKMRTREFLAVCRKWS